jgi:hypothetical protein
MSNRRLLGKLVRRMRQVPIHDKDDEVIDRDPKPVVDFADANPEAKSPGSVHIQGRGWWPANRVVES